MPHVRYALRALLKRPWLTVSRTGLLALGIGATLASWSVVHALTVNPIGVDDPERLVSLGRNSSSYPNFLDLHARTRTLEALTAWSHVNVAVASPEGARSARAALVSPGYFDVFDATLVRGTFATSSALQPADDRTVTISDRLRRSLGSSGIEIGHALEINGVNFTVVGIVDSRFAGPTLEYIPDLWLPLSQEATVRPATAKLQLLTRRRANWLGLSARLAPGVSLEAARADVDAAVEQLKREFPEDNRRLSLSLAPLATDAIPADVRTAVFSVAKLLLAIGVVALIVGSVSNCILSLTSSDARRSELAIARSLGASRRQLLSLLVTENAIVGALGVALGTLLAGWYIGLLRGVRVSRLIPLDADLRSDPTAIALVVVFGFIIPLVMSLVPLRAVTEGNPVDLLRGHGGSSSPRWGSMMTLRGLVITQVALGTVLVSTAVVLQRTTRELNAVELNFDTDQLFVVPIQFGAQAPPADLPSKLNEVKGRIASRPGVTEIAWATIPPLADVNLLQDFVPSAGGPPVPVSGNEVDPEYFRSLGLSFVTGAPFGPKDFGAIVLNETAAELLIPDGSDAAVVQAISSLGNVRLRVAGVVRDSKYFTLDEERRPFAYFLAGYSPVGSGVLLVRATATPQVLLPMLRRDISSTISAPIGEIRSMSDILDMHLGRAKFLALNTAILGVIAVAAAMAGLFGSVSQMALRRRREIGTRLALGATPSASTRPLVRDALRMTVFGLFSGVPVALVFSRIINSQLYEIRSDVPSSIAMAVFLVASGCFLAILLPVLGARRFEPRVLMKAE